ncbi:MAG TPA: polysaccharide deacetylase family protein [Planctomycetaceae bacterium]|nr:polysaccharide deacetylase family protein [Planctomycetaceae bacterium]
MNPLRQAILATMSAVLPPNRWLARGRRRAPTDPPTFSLTFDDGPHPEHTPALLDALAKWGQTATFFVIGREAERYPALMQRIVEAGHAIGNHTFTHGEPKTISEETFLNEIAETDRVLAPWLGPPTRWVRPPKGELTWPKLRGLWRINRTVALWNVDPRDYRMASADELVAWAKAYRPRHGDIVLLHDRVAAAAQIVNALGEAWVFYTWRSVPLDHWLDLTGAPTSTPAPSPPSSGEKVGGRGQALSNASESKTTNGHHSERSAPSLPKTETRRPN